jgi:hypothetical protein
MRIMAASDGQSMSFTRKMLLLGMYVVYADNAFRAGRVFAGIQSKYGVHRLLAASHQAFCTCAWCGAVAARCKLYAAKLLLKQGAVIIGVAPEWRPIKWELGIEQHAGKDSVFRKQGLHL